MLRLDDNVDDGSSSLHLMHFRLVINDYQENMIFASKVLYFNF